jgi:hypothetical protein
MPSPIPTVHGNVDDYGRIDSNIGLGTRGWYNGDFNYDGKINVDDYGIIDSNIGIQGPPLLSAVPDTEASQGAAWSSPLVVSRPKTVFGQLVRNRDDSDLLLRNG